MRRGVDGLARAEPGGRGHLLNQVRADIARHALVDELGRLRRLLHADHRLEDLVVDPDERAGVLGEVAVAGDDHHDGLADVPDDLAGQRVRGAAVGERRVRDEQRQRLGERAGEVLPGVDRHQPVDLDGGRDVDVADPGVGVRGPDERRLQRPGSQVVDVAALTGQQPGVLAAPDRFAEQFRGHGSSAMISAARWTDLTMFW